MLKRTVGAAFCLALPAWVSAATVTYSGWSEPVAGYGDLPLARYINSPTGIGTIVLQADVGKEVVFTSYDISGLRDIAESQSLLLTSVLVEDEILGELSFYPLDLTIPALSQSHTTEFPLAQGTQLTVTFADLSNSQTGYIGIANVQYADVAVPEPASLGVLCLAGLILARRRHG